MNINKKNNLASIFFTSLVIVMLVLSGPVSAIDVNLTTPDIDYLNDDTIDFTIQIQVNDGEFLPVLYTDLILDYGSDSVTCRINDDDTIDNCDFLTVASRDIADLNGDYGYGYGYGYGYEAPTNYGYGYDFGYGYGYGYGERGVMGGSGSGTITYTLTVDVSEIPIEFLNNEIDVEAKVYGGTENNYNYFTGTSTFEVVAPVPVITPVNSTIIQTNLVLYSNVVIDIPADALPVNATQIIVNQVAPIANPTNTVFNILGKVYDFSTDSSTTTFSNFLQITLTYTDAELTQAGISDKSKIYPAFYNGVDWEQLTVINRDPANNKLTFQTDHFTQFTLLADTSIPTPVTPTTNGGDGSSNNNVYDGGELVLPTPEEPVEEPPLVEEPIYQPATPQIEDSPGFFRRLWNTLTGNNMITGQVIGSPDNAENTKNIISVVFIVIILGVIIGGSYLFRRFKKFKK